MTKYILHGGFSKLDNPDNLKLFKEITITLPKKAHILFNYYSYPNDVWHEYFVYDKQQFITACPNKALSFEIANKETFSKQLQIADALWILGGGETESLLRMLRQVKNFKKLLQNKVVGVSSAGTYCLSKYFWNKQTPEYAKFARPRLLRPRPPPRLPIGRRHGPGFEARNGQRGSRRL